MAEERYKIIKTIDHPEWLNDCPIKLCKSQLLFDNKTGNIVLQIKMQNVSDREIKSVYLDIDCFDDAMDPLGSLSDVAYQNVTAKPRDFFGARQPIAMKDSKTTNIKLYVKKVVFADDSVWRNESKTVGVILPKQKKIDKDDDLYVQILRECKINNLVPEFWPDSESEYWRCSCGNVNTVDKMKCTACGAIKKLIDEHFDKQYLTLEKEKVDKAAHIKAEQDQLENKRKEELDQITAEKAKKKNTKKKKILKISIFALMLIVVFIFALTSVIIPASKYNMAMNYIKNSQYAKAGAILNELGNYKDSKEKLEQYKFNILQIGDKVTFGNYEQDNGITQERAIEWRVLAVETGRVLLISDKSLDCKQYDEKSVDVTWETCTLRKWLNSDFIDAAFLSQENKKIMTTNIVNADNPNYGTEGGKNTRDRVFLLSIEEVNKYFNSDSTRQASPTEYAIEQGVFMNENLNANWWLRTPGNYSSFACNVNNNGSVYIYGNHCVYGTSVGVRPALWINLSS